MGYRWGWREEEEGWRSGRGRGRGGWGGPPSMQQANLPMLPPPPQGGVRVAAPCDIANGLDSTVSWRLGRAPYIVVVDIVGKKPVAVHVIPNTAANLPRGVGMLVGQWLIANRVNIVVAARVGPNIGLILSQAGIKIVNVGPGVRVRDCLKSAGLII